MYEELDRRLVNVLQIDPRASWAKVGKVLGVCLLYTSDAADE